MLRRATSLSKRALAMQPRWSGDYIHLSDAENGVAVIELDRPKALNALCDGLMTEVGKVTKIDSLRNLKQNQKKYNSR